MVLEKEDVCWIGARSEGRRKEGGIWWTLLGFRSPLMLGRTAEEADIVRCGWQLLSWSERA